MAINIIICGLLHKRPHVFAEALEQYRLLKEEGIVNKIIYSTWTGTKLIDNLDQNLHNAGGYQVETNPPKGDPGPGHLWYQIRALERGMEECEENDFIFKTRIDHITYPHFLRHLFEDPEKYLAISPNDILSHKIWIPWAEITRPFYIGDEVFYSSYATLKKFTHYDRSYDPEWSPHVIRFIHPFIDKYPKLKAYIRKKDPVIEQHTSLFNWTRKERFTKIFTDFENDIGYLANYYYVLYKYFRIEQLRKAISFPGHQYVREKRLINNNKFTENFNEDKCCWRNLIFCYDDTWIHNIITGKLNHDRFAKRIHEIAQQL